MSRRVVITGMGTVNSLSCDVAAYWGALCAGRSGVGSIEQFDTSAYKVHFAGEVKNFDAEPTLPSGALNSAQVFPAISDATSWHES